MSKQHDANSGNGMDETSGLERDAAIERGGDPSHPSENGDAAVNGPLTLDPSGQPARETIRNRIDGASPDHRESESGTGLHHGAGLRAEDDWDDIRWADYEPYDEERHDEIQSDLGLSGSPLSPDAEPRPAVEHRPTVEAENEQYDPDEPPF